MISVTNLVDKYIGRYYWNYEHTKEVLIRQARDVLVCEYSGDITKFEQNFCLPLSTLLRDIYEEAKVEVSLLKPQELRSGRLFTFLPCFEMSNCFNSYSVSAPRITI